MPTSHHISQGLTLSGNTPAKEGAGALLLWAGLLLLGGICAALGANQQRRSDLEMAQRSQVAVYFQGQSQQLVSQTLQAASLKPGSEHAASELSSTRDRARQALSALQQGGSVSALGVDISPLPPSAQPMARNAQMALSAFDQAAGPILASTESLTGYGKSLSGFDQAAQEFAEASATASKLPRLSSGPWGNAVSQVVQDLVPSGHPLSSSVLLVPSVSPTDTRLAQVRTRVNDIHNLARASLNEGSLTTTDRNTLASMARAGTGMITNMDASLRLRATTVPAVEALPAATSAVPEVEGAATAIISSLQSASSDVSRQWLWVSLVGWGVLLVGVIMLVRQCWYAVDRQYQLLLDGRQGQALLTANDRLSNRLRRILSLESRDEKIKESPESPNFSLVSIINKMLEQRLSAAISMEEQGQFLTQVSHEMEAIVTNLLNSQQEIERQIASSHLNTGHFSGLVTQSSEDLSEHRQQMSQTIDQVSRLSGLTQGALWKLDSVREKTQDASKRIKRLGESAQAVSSSSDSVKDIARQAKVLALNVAVEAAQRGEDGRVFADVAKELESLARDLDAAVNDINFQADGIQDDSRQTVEVMEQGVSSIVECAKMSGDATSETKALLTHTQQMDQKQGEISEGLSSAAKGVLSEQSSLAQALVGIRQQSKQITALRERLSVPRSAIQAFRAWLGQLGRDV